MPYDAFLSHNSLDKPHVIALEDWLRRNGVNCFLDSNDLEPGDVLTDTLGRAMDDSRSAVICIGPHGEGPWHKEEIDTLLNRSIKLARTKNEFRIIPVLLPGADTSNLRWFLQTRLWCDLSGGVTDNNAELLRLRAAILGERAAQPVVTDPHFNPYRGLESFDRENADFFFGRSKESTELAEKLRDWHFACIVGASGNGKSSLARAGLATDAATRILPGVDKWRRIVAKPGSDLLRAILNQIYAEVPMGERKSQVDRAVGQITSKESFPVPADWADGLNRELETAFPNSSEKVLLLIDQLEEVFTHRGFGSVSENQRQQQIQVVLDGLALLSRKGSPRWHFVFTLRSDFLQRCRIAPEFWALIEKEHLSLELDELNEEGWREAIKGPAARAGAYLEAGLVETMLKDVYRQRGSMPLLQLALQGLWKLRDGACLTHAAYTTLGGVANSLQERAEDVLRKLKQDDPNYEAIARNLFLRLTTLGEGVSDTRRRADRAELAWRGTDPAKTDNVVAKLAGEDNRLIFTDEQALEVTHEVLIRDCVTIRGWIEASRTEIPMLRRLTHAARRWQENGCDTIFLNAADPPRETKLWLGQTTLRLTASEFEYCDASRVHRAAEHRHKRRQAHALKTEQAKRLEEAQCAERSIRFREKFVLSLAILAMLTATYAYWQKTKAEAQTGKAERQTRAAQEALVNSFYRTIGVTSSTTEDKKNALIELAQLPGENREVRTMLVRKWFSSPEATLRATADDFAGWNAAVNNLDPPPVATPIDLATAIVKNLETVKNSESRHLAELGEALVTLLQGNSVSKKREFAERAAVVLSNALKNYNDNRLHESVDLCNVIGTLAQSMNKMKATNIVAGAAGELLAAGEHSPYLTYFDLRGFAEALVVLAANMDSQTTVKIAERGATVIGNLLQSRRENNEFELISLGTDLVTLSKRTSASYKKQLVARLMKMLESPEEDNSVRLSFLGGTIGMLSKQLQVDEAISLSVRLISTLEKPMEQNGSRSGFADAVAAMMEKMDRKAMEKAASQLMESPENSKQSTLILRSKVYILTKIAHVLSSEIATTFANQLASALENSKETNVERITIFGEGLWMLLHTNQVTNSAVLRGCGAKALVRAMENPSETNLFLLSKLSVGLGKLTRQLESTNSAVLKERGANALAKAMENSKETNLFVLSGVGIELGRLTPQTGGIKVLEIAKRGANVLIHAMERPTAGSSFWLWKLGEAVGNLAERIDATNASLIAGRAAAALVTGLEESKEEETMLTLSSGENFKPKVSDRVSRLNLALGKLLMRINSADRTKLINRVNEILLNVQGRSIDATICVSLVALWENSAYQGQQPYLQRLKGVVEATFQKPGNSREDIRYLGLSKVLLGRMTKMPSAAESAREGIAQFLSGSAPENSDEHAKDVREMLDVLFNPGVKETVVEYLIKQLKLHAAAKPEDKELVSNIIAELEKPLSK